MRMATSRIVAVPTSTGNARRSPCLPCAANTWRPDASVGAASRWFAASDSRKARRSAAFEPGFAVDLPDDVEQLGVHLGRFVEPPVAQEPVQLLQHRLIVDAVDHVGERARFVGVGVGKDDRARVAVGDRGLGRTGSEAEAQQHGERQASAPAPSCAEPRRRWPNRTPNDISLSGPPARRTAKDAVPPRDGSADRARRDVAAVSQKAQHAAKNRRRPL